MLFNRAEISNDVVVGQSFCLNTLFVQGFVFCLQIGLVLCSAKCKETQRFGESEYRHVLEK